MVAPLGRLREGVKYVDVETPERMSMKPIIKVFEEGLAEAKKRKEDKGCDERNSSARIPVLAAPRLRAQRQTVGYPALHTGPRPLTSMVAGAEVVMGRD